MRQKLLIAVLVLILTLAGIGFYLVLKAPAGELPPENVPSGVVTKAGILEHDETWSGEILVTGSVEVPENVTLAIEPGTTIKFKHWRHGYDEPKEGRLSIDVYGTLQAVGTPDKMIRFTSDAQEPEHGDWGGLTLRAPSSNSQIKYSIVEFSWGNGVIGGKSFLISHSIIRWATGGGIFFGDGATGTIEYSQIYGAGHNNIEIEGTNTAITIKYNTIFGASKQGIIVLDNSRATIHHNLIYGNLGIPEYEGVGISLFNSYADIRYNTVRQHLGPGIHILPYASANIEYNDITGNGIGIQLGCDPPGENLPTIRNNNLHNNENYALYLEPRQPDIGVGNNWWGTENESEIEAKIFDNADGASLGTASFEPHENSAITGDPETGEGITSEIVYDYQNYETYAHQAATENDTFPYVFEDDETRKIVDRIFWSESPTGLAWDGENFWVSLTADDIICYIDENGTILKSFPSPGPWPYGLAWDGENLWVAGYSEDKIYKIDPEGNVLDSFPSPISHPVSLEYDGQHLWTTTFMTTENYKFYLYKFDTSGNLVAKIEAHNYTGLAWDGEYLWASLNYEPHDRIYKVDPSTGQATGWISAPGDRTYDLTWAKGYLWAADWTCESWWGNKIFKLEILNVQEMTT